ncbi:MAG: hypothetical protein CL857_04945 [Cryomorphaceae bacterium]|nr:hypothetical protein [Cryomorphaceae bacterium]
MKNNPDPAWLRVNDWDLVANVALSGEEGELTEKITNAKVYVNDELIGIFETPFRIPLLTSGESVVRLDPVVINNGISATKKVYPFTNYYIETVNLIKNDTVVISPVTSYKSNANFWIEDFEDINISIENDPNTSLANLVLSNESLNSFNGNYYGKVELTDSDSTWVAYTLDQLVIPKGVDSYLEIDYYNTNDVYQGLISLSPSGQSNNVNIRMNAQTPESVIWKKIYIELRELVTASPNQSTFLQSFQANLDVDDTEGLIYFDNIKVIWF